jgi:hypothetical protein
MTNDNNSINSNWNVGTSANGGYENNGDELNEMKKEMIAMKVFLIFYKLICWFLSDKNASA